MSRKYSSNNHIKLVHSGADFFDLICKMIDSAKHSVHLHTYILNNDETGRKVLACLRSAAKRGVAIFVLVDGYASQDLPDQLQEELKGDGINFRFFEPLFQSKHLYFGRRLHHKVVVADGSYSLVGGLNMADRYNDLPGKPAWFDLALYTEGNSAAELQEICEQLWSKKGRLTSFQPVNPHLLDDQISREEIAVCVRRNDWVKRKQEITRTYSEIFRSARHSITIICSYFLPGAKFRLQLKKAAARGVKIRVVLASTSDVPVSKYAERYLYRWMLRYGFEIYEYQPTVLHAKMALADDAFLTIGSYNINNISRYASIELNLDVKNKSFVSEVRQEIDEIIRQKCKPITTGTYKIRLFSLRQFGQWCAFQLVRFMMTVSTFYFKQRE
ncbi:MAG: phospholipase [Citrobacter freundii]|nr:MAG: phospholipase [Citrobacter freundii]